MATVMEVSQLRKRFPVKKGDDVLAVDGISFSIEGGTCFGLLGPNGAGKTTTVEMLEGIVEPSSGEILFQGKPIGAQFREQAGIMFQNTALQDFITVREALVMFSHFYRKTLPIEELIKTCALEEFLDRDTRKLSGGQKQRLLLAVALINDPEVVFLDEPTTGLDPQARRNFWKLVKDIKAKGKTVVLTTHYMEEASLLCDELIFMDHGKIIASGSPSELLANRFNDVLLDLPGASIEGNIPDALTASAFQQVKRTDKGIEVTTTDIDSSIQQLLEQGISLTGMEVRSRTLEDLFIELTGQELRG